MSHSESSAKKDFLGKNAFQNVGTIATVLGSSSVAIAFIALYTSWIFGRGMMAALGFPVSLLSLKSSFDLFPMLSIQYSSFFLFLLVGGFYPLNRRYKSGHRTLYRAKAAKDGFFNSSEKAAFTTRSTRPSSVCLVC